MGYRGVDEVALQKDRKIKRLEEAHERRIAALEARPQGVSQKELKRQLEAVIQGMAPAIAEHTTKALTPLRKENELLKQRICFLEGAHTKRAQ